MERFFARMLQHKKGILFLYTAAILVCAVAQRFVAVNYELTDYLPENVSSVQSLAVMEAEFAGGIPNARVMVEAGGVVEALEYKALIGQAAGVAEVRWLDDYASVQMPLEMLGKGLLDSYYKDGTALFSVTIEAGMAREAVESLRALLPEDTALSGTAVDSAEAMTSIKPEIRSITAVAIPFALLVLLLTTTAWAEPFIFVGCILAAVVLNMGTNLLLGEISFVTSASASILQMAVSMDYSVFLMHSFEEQRKMGHPPETAMAKALSVSVGSILSSGLTTVIGFAALVLMQFKIGQDMGIVLAKSIAISLLVVFTLTPALILYSTGLLEKTQHRPLLPDFAGFASFVKAAMLPVLVLLALWVYPSLLAQGGNSYHYGQAEMFGPDTRVGADRLAIQAVYGKANSSVLLVPRGDTAREQALSRELQRLPQVTGLLSYVDTVGAEIPPNYVAEEARNLFLSERYSRFVITTATDFEGQDAFEAVDRIRGIAQGYYPGAWLYAGETPGTYDLMETVTADNARVNAAAVLAVFVVLLFTFRSLSLPFLLVLCIEAAIWVNMGIAYFTGTPLFYLGYLIISSIQLGATVDYAILYASTYMHTRKSLPRKDALLKASGTTTLPILTSTIVLAVVGILLYRSSSHGLLSQLGLLLGRGAILSAISVIFALPALLYLLDKPIRLTTWQGDKLFSGEEKTI